MKAYLSIEEDQIILISARAEFDGIEGDVVQEVGPGETAFDWSYEKLLEKAPGWVNL